jgi:hypothetical protein
MNIKPPQHHHGTSNPRDGTLGVRRAGSRTAATTPGEGTPREAEQDGAWGSPHRLRRRIETDACAER